MTIEDKILKCKLWLAKKQNFPFYAFLLFQLKMVATEEVPITATDGEHLFYNEKFLAKCSMETIRGLLIHEIGHIANGHLWRVNTKDKLIFNIAGDFVINNNIIKNSAKGLALPKGVCLDKKYDGWATEQVYHDIKDKFPKVEVCIEQDADGKCKAKFHPCGSSKKWTKKNKGELKKLEKKWNKEIKKAAEIYQKQIGDLPGELQRLVEEVEPKVPWQKVLISYVVPSNDDYSYARPDRRMYSSDFIFPSLEQGEKLENIVIGIDTSGSIDVKELSHFVSEVKSILKSFSNVKAWVGSMDAKLYDFKEINDYKMPINAFGGGGTNYNCLFDEIKKRKIDPSVVLVLGDMFATFPKQKPSFDVLWLVTPDHGEPPKWGRKLKYDF